MNYTFAIDDFKSFHDPGIICNKYRPLSVSLPKEPAQIERAHVAVESIGLPTHGFTVHYSTIYTAAVSLGRRSSFGNRANAQTKIAFHFVLIDWDHDSDLT